jgi:hypothetical protein
MQDAFQAIKAVLTEEEYTRLQVTLQLFGAYGTQHQEEATAWGIADAAELTATAGNNSPVEAGLEAYMLYEAAIDTGEVAAGSNLLTWQTVSHIWDEVLSVLATKTQRAVKAVLQVHYHRICAASLVVTAERQQVNQQEDIGSKPPKPSEGWRGVRAVICYTRGTIQAATQKLTSKRKANAPVWFKSTVAFQVQCLQEVFAVVNNMQLDALVTKAVADGMGSGRSGQLASAIQMLSNQVIDGLSAAADAKCAGNGRKFSIAMRRFADIVEAMQPKPGFRFWKEALAATKSPGPQEDAVLRAVYQPYGHLCWTDQGFDTKRGVSTKVFRCVAAYLCTDIAIDGGCEAQVTVHVHDTNWKAQDYILSKLQLPQAAAGQAANASQAATEQEGAADVSKADTEQEGAVDVSQAATEQEGVRAAAQVGPVVRSFGPYDAHLCYYPPIWYLRQLSVPIGQQMTLWDDLAEMSKGFNVVLQERVSNPVKRDFDCAPYPS